MKNNDSNNPELPNRLVTLRWFDTGFCPDQHLADLVAQFETPSPQETQAIAQGLVKPVSVISFVQGNAVDVKITSFHGLIDLHLHFLAEAVRVIDGVAGECHLPDGATDDLFGRQSRLGSLPEGLD